MMRRFIQMLVVALLVVGALAVWRLAKPVAAGSDYPPRACGFEGIKKTPPGVRLQSRASQLRPSLSNLTALAVAAGDRILVGSRSGVELLDPEGRHLAGFATAEPVRCLAALADEAFAVGFQNRVEVRSLNGAVLKVMKLPVSAELTSLAGASNRLYAADCINRCVYVLPLAGDERQVIGGHPRFVVPSPFFDVVPVPDGSVWIANPGMHRLEQYSPRGEFLSAWGRASLDPGGFCGCCNPTHVALAPDGSFVTSEKRIVRIKRYDHGGRFLGIVSGQEDWPDGTTGLDVAVDSTGRILVLDPAANAIRVYLETKSCDSH